MLTKKYSLWLASAFLLSALTLTRQPNEVEAVGVTAEPAWLNTSKAQIQGTSPAIYFNELHPNYTYYKAQMKNGEEPIAFKQTYKGLYNYYTPIARGSISAYSPIRDEEVIWRNNPKKNSSDVSKWTNRTEFRAAEDLVDARLSSNLKLKQVDNSKMGKGYLKRAVKNSENLIEVGRFKGEKGEWRALGYSEIGGSVLNPVFPSEYMSYESYFSAKGRDMATYNHQYRPWKKHHTSDQYRHVYGGSMFDKDHRNNPEHSAYKIKRAAVQRFLAERPNYQAISNSADYWMNYLSLQNDPGKVQLAYFIMASDNGFYYYGVVDSEPQATKNLAIISHRVVDAKGKEIMKFTRNPTEEFGETTKQSRQLVSGETITVETVVKNTTTTGENTEMLRNLTMQLNTKLSNDKNAMTTIENQLIKHAAKPGFDKYEPDFFTKAYATIFNLSQTVTNNSKVAVGKTQKMSKTLTVPFDGKFMGVYSVIDHQHYLNSDNTISTDDSAQIALKVDNEAGNMTNKNIDLLDAKGKVVSKPIPGQAYKLRFNLHYEAKMDATRNISLRINYKITRHLPSKEKDTASSAVDLKNFKPQAGKTYTLTTKEAIVYETGIFDVASTLVMGSGAENYNQKTNDDAQKMSFKDTYDFTLSNVTLIPKEASSGGANVLTYLVKYDVKYDVPAHVTNHAQDVAFKLNVNGSTKTVVKHIKQGVNKNVTVEIKVPTTNKTVKATVLANVDSRSYESNYKNNNGQAQSKIVDEAKIKTPTGAVNNTNKWRQFIDTHNWTGENKTYKGFNNGKTYKFIDFNNGNVQDKLVDLTEGYTIEHVWFRSKTTVDLKEGPKKDGWVDLLKEAGKIKAGYGYELDVEVAYKTNAFTKIEKEVPGKKWVRPGIVKSSMPNNMYVQTPDKAIQSVVGNGGTEASLTYDRKDTANGNSISWHYKIKSGKTLGVATVGKFFIGEDVSNGTYEMTVFTPKAAGLLGKMTSSTTTFERELFDMKNKLEIQVVGSATDDISDHITQ